MTDRWHDYFVTHGAFGPAWLKAAATHWSFNELLYGMIQRVCPPPARVLDIGCGPGWSDLYLASCGYAVTGIDNDPRLVDVARSFAERMQIDSSFEVADAFDLRKFHQRFDLVYSCGVLEHFDRDVTVKLLAEQARCANKVLIQIPTRYSGRIIGFTDERTYDVQQLEDIVRDAGLAVSATFGYGDLCATAGQKWLRLLLPRAAWRLLQNRGFAFSIAVIGEAACGATSLAAGA